MTSEPLEVRVLAFGTIEVSKLIGSIYISLGSDSLVLTQAQITGVYHRCSPMTRDSNKGYQQGIRVKVVPEGWAVTVSHVTLAVIFSITPFL